MRVWLLARRANLFDGHIGKDGSISSRQHLQSSEKHTQLLNLSTFCRVTNFISLNFCVAEQQSRAELWSEKKIQNVGFSSTHLSIRSDQLLLRYYLNMMLPPPGFIVKTMCSGWCAAVVWSEQSSFFSYMTCVQLQTAQLLLVTHLELSCGQIVTPELWIMAYPELPQASWQLLRLMPFSPDLSF